MLTAIFSTHIDRNLFNQQSSIIYSNRSLPPYIVGLGLMVLSLSAPAISCYTITDLGVLPGGISSEAAGINQRGQVVGTSSFGGGKQRAFRYTHTLGMQDLGALQGGSSIGYGINDNGVVVGESFIRNIDVPFKYIISHAFRYTDKKGMEDLSGTEVVTSRARAINNRGQIAGESSFDDIVRVPLPIAFPVIIHPFRYSDKDGYIKLIDPNYDRGRLDHGNAINNRGQVVGESVDPKSFSLASVDPNFIEWVRLER